MFCRTVITLGCVFGDGTGLKEYVSVSALLYCLSFFCSYILGIKTNHYGFSIILDENQVTALEKAKEEKQAHREIETYYPGFLVSQDTYYVEHIKRVGHIYQQTVIDTYSKIGFAELYDRKNALVAADMLNDRVIPFFEQHDLKLMRMLTDRGTEYCGNRENHECELYLAVEDIDHTKIKAKSPQTNGICERFNRTVQNEFYVTAFRKKIYTSIEQLQTDLDVLQYPKNTLWKVLLRKNSNANFYRRNRWGKKVSTAKSGNDKTE